eukprot:364671-Chlamydomonas_euryale.AAC.11
MGPEASAMATQLRRMLLGRDGLARLQCPHYPRSHRDAPSSSRASVPANASAMLRGACGFGGFVRLATPGAQALALSQLSHTTLQRALPCAHARSACMLPMQLPSWALVYSTVPDWRVLLSAHLPPDLPPPGSDSEVHKAVFVKSSALFHQLPPMVCEV